MKKIFLPVVLFAAISLCPANALTWSAASTISGDTDIRTDDTLVYAYYFSDVDTRPATVTVNTVDFSRVFFTPWVDSPLSIGGGNVTATGSTGLVYTADSWSVSNPFASLSEGYRNILSAQMWDFEGSGSATLTLQLNNLTVGQAYLAQFWSNESRQNGEVETRTGRITSSSQSVDIDYNATNAGGGVGQWVTATFTATSTSLSFVFEGTGPVNNVPMLNAMQLRAVPEPGVIGLLSIAGACAWLMRRLRHGKA